MTKKFEKQPPGDVRAFEVGGSLLWPNMTLSEFFVVLALCRRGPSTSAEVAREVSTWLDAPLPPGGLEGVYAIRSAGIKIMRSCHVAYMRMLAGGPAHSDAAVHKCCVEEFERS